MPKMLAAYEVCVLLGTMVDGLARMVVFVLSAVGTIELLRFLQARQERLARPWPQGLLFGLVAAVAVWTESQRLHLMTVDEWALVAPLLARAAGMPGALVGTVASTLLVPAQGPVLLAGLVGAFTAERVLGQSPLFGVAGPWLWLGIQEWVGARPVAHPLLDLLATAAGLVAFVSYDTSVDQSRRELGQAEYAATHDPLTGLLNRAGWKAWLRGIRVHEGALLLADVDNFKLLNEGYGHAAGDAMLVQVAEKLRSCVREEDAVFRYGGDEFGVAVAGATAGTAMQLGYRVRDAVRELAEREGMPALDVSVGVAVGSWEGILERADAALLAAKAAGKGRIILYGDDMVPDDPHQRLLRLTAPLRQALARSPEGVVVTDLEHRILDASPAYSALSGVPPGEWRLRRPGLFTASGRTDPRLYEQLRTRLQAKEAWRGEFLDRRPDGTLWWADWSIFPLLMGEETAVGYLGIVRDATPVYRRHLAWVAQALAMLSEVYDPTLPQHLLRVGCYISLLSGAWQEAHGRRDVDLNPPDLGIAAMFHDVGKFEVPKEVLTKRGPLTAEEYRIVQRHPMAGALFLERIRRCWPVPYLSDYTVTVLEVARRLTLSHHERWDGTGYPQGLRGTHIPLVARLFSVVDVYDALLSRRPYKEPWPEEQAAAYVVEQAEKMFDPRVVEVFLALRGTERWQQVSQSPSLPGLEAETAPRTSS